ncbi:MAG: Rieske 2Fe-2S domain-containing protein, partial [Chloroflexi bacterium]|nr:Rieske 2Fe-2S domain-containing protein [Chloroflexota bacterium]
MLSAEDNALLTAIGPGTPAGALMRRYWHPLLPVGELPDGKPRKRVRLLGENLVLFRWPGGRYALLAEHCQHRGVSLYYGFQEEDGVRCAYHGWKYGLDGACLEQPFEPAGSSFKERVCQPAYEAQEFAGLIWAYLGPKPAPLLPHWDVLVREDGARHILIYPTVGSNWLQIMENGLDPVHLHYLHGHMMETHGSSAGAYFLKPMDGIDFKPFELGIWAHRIWPGSGHDKGNPVIFPNVLRVPTGPYQAIHWRVPIDDTHTSIVVMNFLPGADATPGDPPC